MAHCATSPESAIGRAEAQDFVPDHHLPDIYNEGERKQRARQRRVPAPLLGDHDLRRQLALALLDREFARGQIGGDLLRRVVGGELGAIGVDRGFCRTARRADCRASQNGPANISGALPDRAAPRQLGDHTDADHVLRNVLRLAAHCWTAPLIFGSCKQAIACSPATRPASASRRAHRMVTECLNHAFDFFPHDVNTSFMLLPAPAPGRGVATFLLPLVMTLSIRSARRCRDSSTPPSDERRGFERMVCDPVPARRRRRPRRRQCRLCRRAG